MIAPVHTHFSSGMRDSLRPLLAPVLDPARAVRDYWRLPRVARQAGRADRHGLAMQDPGIPAVVRALLDWTYLAQDCSRSRDGGVARHYSLIDGWGPSYPETTGYIIPSLLQWYEAEGEQEALDRARRMLDWLCRLQFESGAFPGGVIGATPCVPVTFNTGQILLGLAAAVGHVREPEAALSRYRDAMHQAADWLCATQDSDGAWRRYPTPFARAGEKAYETHVAWGLLEAERVAPGHGYGEAALRNIRWALRKQSGNGWFDDCCLDDKHQPLTHTIGYVLRGILEGARLENDAIMRTCAARSLDAIAARINRSGFLAGRFDKAWRPTVKWACLTGSSQLAHCFLMAVQDNGSGQRDDWLDAGRRLNRHVRRSIRLDGPGPLRGAVRGSFPIDGDYGRFQYLNWAAKFALDANRLEQAIVTDTPPLADAS